MILKLNAELTIGHGAELKQQLLTALASGGPVLVDASAVTDVDLSALQILYAACLRAARAGTTVSFAEGGRSEVMEKAALAAGFFRRAGGDPSGLFEVRSNE